MATFFSILAEVIAAIGMFGVGAGVLFLGAGIFVVAAASTDDKWCYKNDFVTPTFTVIKRNIGNISLDVHDHTYDDAKTEE